MPLPTVAIIGRPNVGKSSLLNALAGSHISIVEPTAGVTRDRVSTVVEKNNRFFELIDTGGYGAKDADRLDVHINEQIQKAIDSATLVLFMVDIREGLMPLDKTIARMLRRHNVSIIGVANKADNVKMFPAALEFSELGLGDFICISARNNLNKNVLSDKILEKLSNTSQTRPAEAYMKIAVVGKRNAGKSSLVNTISGTNRVIVSAEPGTTRDAVDMTVEKDGRTFILIDTAGIRKKNKISDNIEFYGYVRATRSIQRADVVFFMMDSTTVTSQVDKKLAAFISENYKICILVVNKWDLAKQRATTSDYEDYLTAQLPSLRDSPIAFITATEGKNVKSLLDLAGSLFKQANRKIPTAKLNKALELIKHGKSTSTGRVKGRPKIYYATQIAVKPVTILMFVNKPELFEENYRRFIIGKLKSMLGIEEVPLKLLLRKHRI